MRPMTLRELVESIRARSEFSELRYYMDLEKKMHDEQIARYEQLESEVMDAVIEELVKRVSR